MSAQNLSVLALVMARSGSKSLPHKNIKDFKGEPLLAHSVEHGLSAQTVSRVILSTDSEKYAEIGRQHGAETPFIRPAELAQDDTLDLPVVQHTLQWLQENEGKMPDIVVHLRPTHPIRNPKVIDQAVQILIDNPQYDSVRTVTPLEHPVWKTWLRDETGQLKPTIEDEKYPEAYNMPRQALPASYIQNANIDVVRSSVVMEKNSMTGWPIYGLVEEVMVDIDDEKQFQAAETHNTAAG